MIFLTLMGAAVMAHITPPQWTHSVPVAHGNGQVTATYFGRPDVTTRQIGMSAGTRMSSERCLWRADIIVERRLAHSASSEAALRDMADTKSFSGSQTGTCAINRHLIDQQIAAKTPEIKAHLVAVAARDQNALRAEIKTLAPPSGR